MAGAVSALLPLTASFSFSAVILCPSAGIGNNDGLHRLPAFGLGSFLPLRFQSPFRQSALFLRVAEQVIQVHYRSFVLFRFHDLRCGFYRFCIWLYRFFFYFHLRLLYFLNLRLDKNRLCFTLFSLDAICSVPKSSRADRSADNIRYKSVAMPSTPPLCVYTIAGLP